MAMMDRVLGASWRTALGGILASVIGLLYTAITEHGIPQTTEGWLKVGFSVLVGYMGLVAKDRNVTNAATPQPPRAVEVTHVLNAAGEPVVKMKEIP